MKRAFLFPGQGAQEVGMGKDFYDNYEEARAVYDKASEITKIDVKKLCFEGPEEELKKTENTQIALLTTSLAILEVLKKNNIEANIACGLSLGEYGALVYSEILSLEEGLRLISKRGKYMGTLAPNVEYKMVAVIGLDASRIEEICKEQDGFVVPSNYNYSGQTVITGEADVIEEILPKLKEAGATRVIELKTSGPFHTEKLEKAKQAYKEELAKAKFEEKFENVKVIKNLDGTFYNKGDDLKEILSEHITSPLRFDKTIKLMEKEGIEEYIQIGPGKSLTGFIKKENRGANVVNINSVEALKEYLEKERPTIKSQAFFEKNKKNFQDKNRHHK